MTMVNIQHQELLTGFNFIFFSGCSRNVQCNLYQSYRSLISHQPVCQIIKIFAKEYRNKKKTEINLTLSRCNFVQTMWWFIIPQISIVHWNRIINKKNLKFVVIHDNRYWDKYLKFEVRKLHYWIFRLDEFSFVQF